MKKAKNCTWCGHKFNKEERANPRQDLDKDPICDECYGQEFEDDCSRCGEYFEKSQLDNSPGKIIVIFQEARALAGSVSPGYYRVKSWPIYADGMIEGYVYADALERVAELDTKAKEIAADSEFIAGVLCEDCQIEALK